jgi:hypothetical protein
MEIKETPLVQKKMDEEFNTLQKIVNQLEWCGYEAIGGPLINNIAFLKLKQMAKKDDLFKEGQLAAIQQCRDAIGSLDVFGLDRDDVWIEQKEAFAAISKVGEGMK